MDLHEAQREYLQVAAQRSGRWKDLLYFHAALRDNAAIEALQAAVQGHPEDVLIHRLLVEPSIPVPPLLDGIGEASDPWVFYSLVKRALTQSDVASAMRVTKALLEQGRPAVLLLNLIARFLAQNGEGALALQILEQSLRRAPYQKDMASLRAALRRGDAVGGDLYLDVLPKQAQVGCYLPAYNVEAYLREAIEGLLGQCCPLADLVVIDDGSQDGSADIARAYPVRMIDHGENRGLAVARNTAFRAIEATLVAGIDSDAAADPGYLKCILMEYENAPPGLVGVCGRTFEKHTETPADHWRSIHLSQDTGPARRYSDALPLEDPELAPAACQEWCTRVCYMPGCNTVYRREAVLRIGGYDERHRSHGEDGDLAHRLAAAGHGLASTPHALVYHLRRDTLESLLRAAWMHAFWRRREAGRYATVQGLAWALEEHVERAAWSVGYDAEHRLWGCAAVSLLELFTAHRFDLRYAEEQGVLTSSQRAALEGRLLHALAQAGGEAHAQILRGLPGMAHDGPADLGELPEELRPCFEPIFARMEVALTKDLIPLWQESQRQEGQTLPPR